MTHARGPRRTPASRELASPGGPGARTGPTVSPAASPRNAEPRRRPLALAAGLLLAWLAAPIAGEPPSPRLLFVGIDGATWKVMGPLLETGQLPTFARLRRDGAHTPQFDTLEVTASPLIWTTVVTGRTPRDHGVDAFVTELPNGTKVPITSSSRTARALWEVANRRGLTTGIVGWWATWPAEQVDGYLITDHANAAFSEFMVEDGRLWVGADPERLRQLRRDFFPLDLAPILETHWISRQAFPYDDLQRRGGFSPAQMAQLRAAPWNVFADYYSLLKTMYRVDYPLFEVTRDLMTLRPTDLTLLYLHGPDPVQHMAWDLAEPGAYAVPNPDLERDHGLIEGIYRAVDSMLGELLARVGPETWVVIASDHGAEPAPAATGDPRSGRPGEHPASAKGVLFLTGPGVRAGHRIAQADPYDLMPTLTWLLGLPLSDELEGRILTEAFDPAFVERHPVRRVASYGVREVGDPQQSPADRLMLELLRSLGYVGN